MGRCFNCKFLGKKQTISPLGNRNEYYVCENQNAFYFSLNNAFWKDGSQVAPPEGVFSEIIVGLNFGCVNWEDFD